MSRIGKKIIEIPQKTEVTFNANVVTVKGPLGTLSKNIPEDIDVVISEGKLNLLPKSENPETQKMWGSYASHIKNMIDGVNKAFEKKLIVEGIGFKSDVKGQDLNLALGFSHPVKVIIPQTLKVTAEKNIITVSGMDKDSVGRFASEVRSLKKPEPYKGKGIRYDVEVIRRKQGKKSV